MSRPLQKPETLPRFEARIHTWQSHWAARTELFVKRCSNEIVSHTNSYPVLNFPWIQYRPDHIIRKWNKGCNDCSELNLRNFYNWKRYQAVWESMFHTDVKKYASITRYSTLHHVRYGWSWVVTEAAIDKLNGTCRSKIKQRQRQQFQRHEREFSAEGTQEI